MKKITTLAILALFGSVFGATPTLDIIGDSAKDVTVNGKTIKFDGEIKEINGQKLMAFGEKPFALPAKTLVGEKGSIVMEYAINTKPSKNGARSPSFPESGKGDGICCSLQNSLPQEPRLRRDIFPGKFELEL